MGCRRWSVALGLALVPVFAPALAAQGAGVPPALLASAPEAVFDPVTPLELEGDLRRLPAVAGWTLGSPVSRSGEQHEVGRSYRAGEPRQVEGSDRDPLLARQESAAPGGFGEVLSGPDPAFPGLSFSGTNPPDTVGAVGLDHYIQMVNAANGASFGSVFAIYDKRGERLVGPTAFEGLWT